MKKQFCFLMAVAVFITVLLSSCRKEEPLLVDDQEIFGSSGTEETKEAGKKNDDIGEEKSAAAELFSETEAFSEHEIRIPTELVSSRTMVNLNHLDYWYEADRFVAMDGDVIWYADMNARGNVSHVLHRIDKNTGEDRVFCSEPECPHNSEKCGGFLCSGYLLDFETDDGVIWYCWDASQEANDIHISCIDTQSGEHVLRNWIIRLNNIGDFDRNIYPMDIQCSFLNGYVITVQRSLEREIDGFKGNVGFPALTGRCLIEVWKMPDLVNEPDALPDAEIPLERTAEIFDHTLEKQYWYKHLVLPFGNKLYILESGSEPENPDDPMEEWIRKNRFSLYAWDEGSMQPELLLESAEEAASEFWVTDDGIRMLLFETMDEISLVNADPDTKTVETLSVLDRGYNSTHFAEGCLIGSELAKEGTISENGSDRVEKYHILDLNGNKTAVIEKELIDPRYKDPSKAPAIFTRICFIDPEGLYVTWKGGLILLPYSDDPAVFYGYE